jgi:CRISPR/Cas system-associated protein Csm6
MGNAEEKLADYFDKLMYIAKRTGKTPEDSVLLAGAMMACAKMIYYEHLSPQEAKDLETHNSYDILDLIKPTIH